MKSAPCFITNIVETFALYRYSIFLEKFWTEADYIFSTPIGTAIKTLEAVSLCY
jgi:hypothetical protein